MEIVRQTARRLLSEAHLASLRFTEVTTILKDAECELARRLKQEKEKV
ncbi:MAG TPA: hypothetical protein VMU19_00980 [Bryobacteraceae bacterium]|nr:hypothetical protein [Bryobacteraceae bacterium]